MKIVAFVCSLLFVTIASASNECPSHKEHQTKQSHVSPYSGQQNSEYKTISPDDAEKYRNGEGMGMARAAELNHYPGPKHLLELSEEIKLTSQKRIGIEKIYDDMHQQAVNLGAQILHAEKELDQLFSTGKATPEEVQTLTRRIGNLNADLRYVHLSAHLKTRGLLSEEEISQYEMLRGYHHHQ